MGIKRSNTAQECVEFVREKIGNHWILAAPLGLGKPNHILNALYQAAKDDPAIRLELFTALSLNPPLPSKGLKQRFLGPFLERQFGNYPRLQYLEDLNRGRVPENISISEFYFRSGTRLGDLHAQRHYVSSNYTHVARDMEAKGVNLLIQMVAVDANRPGFCSLSCNPDVTIELLQRMGDQKPLLLAQINEDLPYMGGDAELPLDTFDLALENHPQTLFAVPRMTVDDQDYLIGLHASQLLRDGGTLQLGIGSLGDALCFFTVLRQRANQKYRQLLAATEADGRVGAGLRSAWGGDQPFQRGLYAASEMFMDGFLHLYDAGVLKRRVYDDLALQTRLNEGSIESPAAEPQAEKAPQTLGPQVHELRGSAILHAAFFLGSKWMYQRLKQMSSEERSLFQMTSVARVNQLYGGEALDRAQRLEARCVNTTMKVTLLGAAASDQLQDGQVVSGVGGQYNFVAMAHALDRGRSVLMLRSHRGSGRNAESNIVWEFPHTTIPRHLRDIVVTEYGVADLRGQDDETVIQRMLCLTDSRWQESLRALAVKAGKLSAAWRIPAPFTRNTPEWVSTCLGPWRNDGTIGDYPFGSDFTAEEEWLARALALLGAAGKSRTKLFLLFLKALVRGAHQQRRFQAGLARMGLQSASSLSEWIERRMLCFALQATGGKDLKLRPK